MIDWIRRFAARGVRRFITDLGASFLVVGSAWAPFGISGFTRNAAFASIMFDSVGALLLVLARISVDPPLLLVKRLLWLCAVGIMSGCFVIAAVWAWVHKSWFGLTAAVLVYVLLAFGIRKAANLRTDRW